MSEANPVRKGGGGARGQQHPRPCGRGSPAGSYTIVTPFFAELRYSQVRSRRFAAFRPSMEFRDEVPCSALRVRSRVPGGSPHRPDHRRGPDAPGTRVPALPDGHDPDRSGEGFHDYEQFAREGVFVEPQLLRMVRAIHPFAYRLTEHGVRRIPTILRAGDVAVITRESAPHVAPNEIYAVRLEGEVLLSLLMWNQRELLVLPAEGSDDFAVLPANGERQLRHHIVGHVATVVREARSVRRGD